MADRDLITIDRARELFDYNPETGELRWRVWRPNGVKAGDIAGISLLDGYRTVSANYRRYFVHRLAWFMSYESWPVREIDHIDGNRTNNRISNLREATTAENSQNRKKRSDSTSGYTGVTWHKAAQLWAAQIGAGGKRRHLGCFRTPEEAYEAYLTAKADMHRFQPLPR